MRRLRAAKAAKQQDEEQEDYVDFYDELSEDEDYRAHGRKSLKKPPVFRPQPLISFAELYEQAQLLYLHRAS